MIHAARLKRATVIAILAAITLAPVALAADPPALTGVVNVNTASVEELQLLPGIGAARADAVIALRKQRGGFKSVEELTEVKGIGAVGLDRMRPYVRLQGKTTAQRP